MPTLSASPCGSCAQHRTQSLVKLGLSPGKWDYLVALAGNPNVGKSTVFNALTGLRQHTGNWPGKTVVRAEGVFEHEGKRVKVVDLPGTYSLQAGSADEEVAEADAVATDVESNDLGIIYAYSFPSIRRSDGRFPIKVGLTTTGDADARVTQQC